VGAGRSLFPDGWSQRGGAVTCGERSAVDPRHRGARGAENETTEHQIRKACVDERV